MSTQRRRRNRVLRALPMVFAAIFTLLLSFATAVILFRGLQGLTMQSLTSSPSLFGGGSGLLPALWNTLLVTLLCLSISLPIGMGAAVFLQVYLPPRKRHRWPELLLDGVLYIPTIVSGYFGLLVFSRLFGLKTSLLAGSLTMVVTILPLVVSVSSHTIRSVPGARIKQARAMGVSNWHLVKHIILPECRGHILYVVVLAAMRVVAEGAALLLTAGTGEVVAKNLGQAYTQSGGTLAVMLYTSVQSRGDTTTAFAIAALLLMLVAALNLLGYNAMRRTQPYNR